MRYIQNYNELPVFRPICSSEVVGFRYSNLRTSVRTFPGRNSPKNKNGPGSTRKIERLLCRNKKGVYTMVSLSMHSPNCLLASAQVGSPPLSIITASMTFSTKAGGLAYDLISVMSFLFSDSKALVASARAGKASSRSC